MVAKLLNSLWHESTAQLVKNRPALDSDHQCDVAIIGGGYSGLWSAYYLKKLLPDLRIVVIEQNNVGFGASGRNGGWCSGFLPISLSEIEQTHGRAAAVIVAVNLL